MLSSSLPDTKTLFTLVLPRLSKRSSFTLAQKACFLSLVLVAHMGTFSNLCSFSLTWRQSGPAKIMFMLTTKEGLSQGYFIHLSYLYILG